MTTCEGAGALLTGDRCGVSGWYAGMCSADVRGGFGVDEC